MNIYTTLFQDISNIICLSCKAFSNRAQGIKYTGFTYYPRTKDFKDPPYEPSKLFFIKRLKSMRGRNPTERQSLAMLNIDGKKKHNGHINIVKNIPSINALLWKIKHLVDIKPITWKGELPKDFLGTHLRDTGELIISPKLYISEEHLKKSTEMLNTEDKLNRKYLKIYLRNKWWNGFTGTA